MNVPAEVCDMTIVELASRVEDRTLSPVEITDAFLDRIGKIDPELHSFTLVAADHARRAAMSAEREIREGRRRGPLHGIPIALKDNIDTAGIPTTASSRVLEGRVPSADADVVRALTNAGCVVLGKLNMSEFAMGLSYLDDFAPPVRNPWDPSRIAGSSSSGSAAGVAAGLCAGSFGTDTGGSIRLPASYTGVVGLKPTFDVISCAGTIPLAWSLDHVGPMARSVQDVGLLLRAACRRAEPPRPSPAPGTDRPLRGLRIGVPEAWIGSAAIEPDVVAAFRAAVSVMEGLGAAVEVVSIRDASGALGVVTTIMACEAAAYHEPWLRRDRDAYGWQCRNSILTGLAFSAVDYLRAQRVRQQLCDQVNDVMARVDALITPALPRVAPTQEEHEGQRGRYPSQPFLGLFNLTGQPSLSLPCGYDRNGMPIGLLVSGRAYEDETVIRIAQAYEDATPWHDRRPPLRPAVGSRSTGSRTS